MPSDVEEALRHGRKILQQLKDRAVDVPIAVLQLGEKFDELRNRFIETPTIRRKICIDPRMRQSKDNLNLKILSCGDSMNNSRENFQVFPNGSNAICI